MFFLKKKKGMTSEFMTLIALALIFLALSLGAYFLFKKLGINTIQKIAEVFRFR